MPDGLEHDAYDERAIHVTGWQGSQLVAGARLVLPEDGHELPTEAVLGERVPPAGEVVNLDRVLVAPGTEQRLVMFRALLAAAWLETRAYGFHRWAGLTSLAVVRLYRQMGFSVKMLSGSKSYWGEQRYPVRFEPADAAAEQERGAGRW